MRRLIRSVNRCVDTPQLTTPRKLSEGVPSTSDQPRLGDSKRLQPTTTIHGRRNGRAVEHNYRPNFTCSALQQSELYKARVFFARFLCESPELKLLGLYANISSFHNLNGDGSFVEETKQPGNTTPITQIPNDGIALIADSQ